MRVVMTEIEDEILARLHSLRRRLLKKKMFEEAVEVLGIIALVEKMAEEKRKGASPPALPQTPVMQVLAKVHP